MLAKHDFLYLSLHLLEWNESKLPMFIKIYTIRDNFQFLKKINLRKFSTLHILPTFHLKSKNPHNSFNIYQNLMKNVLFERSYKYLPSLNTPQKIKVC